MDEARRGTARRLAQKFLAADDPLGWFEALYAQAEGDSSTISWADLTPNPNLVEWLDANCAPAEGGSALTIGCGLGDDAEELAARGLDTNALDISSTAIDWCRRRFPESSVTYLVADLFRAPTEWQGAFSLVVESYTLQVLPPDLRREAIQRIMGFVAPRGTLLVIARGRETTDPEGNLPWPLTREEMDSFCDSGFTEVSFEDYLDQEDPPVRRFRAVYRREAR
jgi:SAM-dependent methyltransferase